MIRRGFPTRRFIFTASSRNTKAFFLDPSMILEGVIVGKGPYFHPYLRIKDARRSTGTYDLSIGNEITLLSPLEELAFTLDEDSEGDD